MPSMPNTQAMMQRTAELLRHRWTLDILYILHRFRALDIEGLQTHLPYLDEAAIEAHLQALTSAGLLEVRPSAYFPTTVYTLSRVGRSMEMVVDTLRYLNQ